MLPIALILTYLLFLKPYTEKLGKFVRMVGEAMSQLQELGGRILTNHKFLYFGGRILFHLLMDMLSL